MWFRVEVARDGSIASCEVAEGSFKKTHRVFYVEADNPVQAVDRAMRAYRSRQERDRKRHERCIAQARTAGLCGKCYKRRPEAGKRTCRRCLDAWKANEKKRAVEGRRVPLTPQEWYDKERKRWIAKQKKRRANPKHRFSYRVVTIQLALLRQAFEAFERSDRAWFVSELERLQSYLETQGFDGISEGQPVAAE